MPLVVAANPSRVKGPLDIARYFPLCPPEVPPHEQQARDILERSVAPDGPRELDRLDLVARPDLLVASWRDHKEAILRAGQYERGFRVQLVIEALVRSAPEGLAVAQVRAGEARYVAWLDLAMGALVTVLDGEDAELSLAEATHPI
jgi:hypothetical protein